MADMRIGGLASGMDTDQIIKDLMKAERIPLDKLEQKKQYLEWQRDDYRDLNKMMFEFSNNIFDGVMKQGTYTQKTINQSNPSIVDIKSLSATTDFSGTLDVTQLAKAATMSSSGSLPTITDPNEKLSNYVTGTQTITIQAIGSDGKLETTPTSITFDPAEYTLNSLIEKINKETNVSMFYDSTQKKVSMMAKNTGDTGGNEIVLTGSFLTNELNLGPDNTTSGANGKNAEFTFNGLTTSRSSNRFTINGVEYNLKNIGNTTFSSSPDTDKILDEIVKFVDEYNKLIEKVNGEVNEKKYRDFQPLTAEQKESMEEKEIELWEEKSRSGTLRNDSVLSSGLNKMRTDMYTPISGGTSGFDQLTQIGIKTSSNYLDRGKLIIDESKLKEAISKDPNAIYEIFAKDGATSNEQGIARRLRDTLKDTMDSIEQKAGKASSTNNTFTLGRLLNNMDSQMDRFEDRLNQVEDRYWRQFTAMEKAIQRSNQQSMFLMNQFGG